MYMELWSKIFCLNPNDMDVINFIGRLHPLIVHLPIGFLFLALLLEWFMRSHKSQTKERIVLFILVLGALSSIWAIICGWLLALDGDYDPSSLMWHRLLGIGVGVLAIIAPVAKRFSWKTTYRCTLILIGLLVLSTGHFGGSLTHGSDYLLQPLRGNVSREVVSLHQYRNPDSIEVYHNFIRPLFERKCNDCHNSEKDMGGLNMTSYSKLMAGGDHGNVINTDVWSSELIRRVTLSPTNEKFMPPKGVPLSYHEISLLSWWVEHGADSTKTITQMDPDNTIAHILASHYKIDTSSKPFIEKTKAPNIDEAAIEQLTQKGWLVTYIAENNNFVEVSINKSYRPETLNISDLDIIKDNITWLELSGLTLSDKDIEPIFKFRNVTKLLLDNNEITEKALRPLAKLKHLESLNLNNNPIKVENLDWIQSSVALKRVYLWKTKTTREAVHKMNIKFPDIQLIL